MRYIKLSLSLFCILSPSLSFLLGLQGVRESFIFLTISSQLLIGTLTNHQCLKLICMQGARQLFVYIVYKCVHIVCLHVDVCLHMCKTVCHCFFFLLVCL